MGTSLSAILINLFKNNHEILHMQVKDITQAESLLQPPSGGNCMNWVVGHVLDTYHTCMDWLGLPALWTESDARLYGYGSEPITDPKRACELTDLLRMLDIGLEQITTRLAALESADMERTIEIWLGPVTLIEALYHLFWHAAYHTGQLEQLRQLAGKHEKLI